MSKRKLIPAMLVCLMSSPYIHGEAGDAGAAIELVYDPEQIKCFYLKRK